MNYEDVHYALKDQFGPARDHLCACGAPAAHWAYQHTGEAVTDEWGSVYSLDLNDYAPMCYSCHFKLDGHGAKAAEALNRRCLENPEFAENRRQRAIINHTEKRRCLECGMVSVRTGIGRHQQVSGHVGLEDAP